MKSPKIHDLQQTLSKSFLSTLRSSVYSHVITVARLKNMIHNIVTCKDYKYNHVKL